MFNRVKKTSARVCVVFVLSVAAIGVALVVITPSSRARVNQKRGSSAGKKSRRPDFVPGEVLVRYRTEKTAADKTTTSALASSDGTALPIAVEDFAGSRIIPGARLVRVAPERTLEAVQLLRQQPDVMYAEPNYIVHSDATPNDTLYNLNASLRWNLEKIAAPQAWDTIRGSKSTAAPFFTSPQVVIGVIDQGIEITHPDLQANIWVNTLDPVDGMDNDGNGRVDDRNGFNFFNNNGTLFSGQNTETHASHVAGIAGAVGDNNNGTTGVNWAVGLMSLKFLDPFGNGTTAKAIEAVEYAKLMRDRWNNNPSTGANIRVLNASFGGGGFSQMFEDAINSANASGILFVAAAGNVDIGTMTPNNDLVPHYPSSFSAPNIIAVAATNQTDALAADPLPGFTTHFGASSVDLAAPGVSILSTTPKCTLITPDPDICAPDFPTPHNPSAYSYTLFSGTSMAAPHVSGSAALLWAQNPNLTVQQVKSMLLFSGDVLPSLVDKTLTSRRLNLNKSLQSVQEADTVPPGPVLNFHLNSQTGRTLNIGWTSNGDDDDFGGGPAALYQLSFTDSAPGSTPIVLKGVVPSFPNNAQTASVTIPFRHTAGTLTLREFDNKGNEGIPQTLSVNIPLLVGDPYLPPAVGPAAPLSTSTAERQNLNADDLYADYIFPSGFTFPFFGVNHTGVTISSNGALYFGDAPVRPCPPGQPNCVPDADDVPSSPRAVGGFEMIAGLWDDLTLETSLRSDAGVYVSHTPNSITFRWQAKPCNFDSDFEECTGGADVNFEIELRTDGTIKTRYGSGNTQLFPTVGIGGGNPEAYVVGPTHTSEETPIDMTNKGEVTFTPRALAAPTIQFSQPTYSIGEGGTSLTVTVTRTGDTSGTSTVDYFTADTDNFTVNCATFTGNAFARCDFATSVDTLTFGPGETSKTFAIPIINDQWAEGNETFGVALSNPTGGATVGAPSTATITIVDNDAVTGTNPIFLTPFFVRQNYLDFLSREPEVGEPWSPLLNGCSDVNNNPNCDRLTVSGAIFGSQEFQLKGYYNYRFYKLAFNRLPLYEEIVIDMRKVTGTTQQDTFNRKAQFATNFVLRTEFANLYNGLSNTQYVNTLMSRYSLSGITTTDPNNPDQGGQVTLTTQDLIDRLNGVGGTLTRAQVLRAIADSQNVFTAEFNQGFVAFQYYGYLRRIPDAGGYNAWLTYMNGHPTDFRTMVNGFMNSDEYRKRFGPNPDNP